MKTKPSFYIQLELFPEMKKVSAQDILIVDKKVIGGKIYVVYHRGKELAWFNSHKSAARWIEKNFSHD